MSEYGCMPGRYPAIVRSYNQQRRTCRVEIPGLTEGGDVLPEAEIEYSIGDKSRSGDYETEIEILPGDTVWIAFIGGDARYPIITGCRNPQAGNSVDWRRFHHKNMELLADELMLLIAQSDILIKSSSKITLEAPEVLIDTPITTFTGDVSVQGTGDTSAVISGNITVDGNINATGSIIDVGGNTNNHSH
ncbi:hypothetical protein SAMN05216302_104610 [Nitrosomonas aestuarii]|uniref:Phage baseplate assembly protein V n=1 Tax=Nitrosomonas aestuarii TaxID=52441 RepID=A0A1I4G2G2_9PROT|nr:hypothetical protein [Nitrosomonas aestuarii]SFL23893.1 hypothetical protein SAMN05216302_104610 [Nitrosomonas aestuarii]